MSEKISKISVDGVIYDIASTGGGEVPGDIQEQLSALENKVTEEASTREEGDAKLSEKIESEASRVDGMVNQINENVASSIETLNNNLVQAIETINGGVAAEVTNREEGDAKLQAAIDELAEKVNGEDADFTELEEKIKKNAADIATVNNNLVEAVNNINKNVADGFSTINGGLNNEIRPELEKAVKYEDTATEQNPGRKTIFLNNHDNICGKTTDGSAVNIAMVSKWNKVDLGSSSVEINLNGSAERPTYNDSKQIALLEDVHGNMETIALVKKDDLTYELQVGDKIAGTINIPADQFLKSVEYSAEDKSLTFVFNTSEGEQTSVVDLSSLVDTYVAGNGIELIENGFSIKLDPSSESYLSVSEAGIKVEGINEIKKNVQEVAANLVTVNENLASSIDAINKKAVKYEDVAGLSNTLEALNATVQILQSKVDVLTKTNTEVVSVDGSAGELKDSSKDYIVSGSINENAEIVGKSISLKSIKVSDNARLKLNAGDVEAKDLNISGSFPKANGNTVISVNNAEFIVFKDMVFDASEVYNGIEIGLASNSVLPKNILFDNCKFQGEFSNNAILVFGTQDNAIITLNNCYFEKISNALRLSNKSNASGVVVNINNCTVDQWETRAPWQGFLICEDYTNKTEEEVNANNLFGDGKITVNFNNLVHAGVKINPADPASVCGTKNESQVVMVCQDAVAGPEGDYCLSYDAAKFPVVSFK
jgi:predicted  nucleic acid-binding Zn-ribbon protein